MAGKSSIFYSFGPSHEFIHHSNIDEILKRCLSDDLIFLTCFSRKKSLQQRRVRQNVSDGSNILEYPLQGTRIKIQEQVFLL